MLIASTNLYVFVFQHQESIFLYLLCLVFLELDDFVDQFLITLLLAIIDLTITFKLLRSLLGSELHPSFQITQPLILFGQSTLFIKQFCLQV